MNRRLSSYMLGQRDRLNPAFIGQEVELCVKKYSDNGATAIYIQEHENGFYAATMCSSPLYSGYLAYRQGVSIEAAIGEYVEYVGELTPMDRLEFNEGYELASWPANVKKTRKARATKELAQ